MNMVFVLLWQMPFLALWSLLVLVVFRVVVVVVVGNLLLRFMVRVVVA